MSSPSATAIPGGNEAQGRVDALLAPLLRIDPAWPFSLAIAASVFSGHWSDAGSPLPFDRVLWVLAVLLLLSRIPVAARWRLQLRLVHVAILGASLYVVASGLVSGTLGASSFDLLDRFGLVPFLSFMLAPAVYGTPRRRRILLGTLAAVGAYVGVTTFAEGVGADFLVFPKYILDPKVGIHFERARGPFAEAGANGLALWECGVAATLLASITSGPKLRLALSGVALLCTAGILFTLTRAIWLGAVVAGALSLIAARNLRKYLAPAAVAAAAIVLGAFTFVPGLQAQAAERGASERPIWDRENLNRAAINMATTYPLLGIGWNRFEAESPRYYQQSPNIPLTTSTDVHNVFLGNLAEIGLVGTSLWALALALAVSGGLGRRRGPPDLHLWRLGLLAVAVNWLVVANFGPLSYAFPNLLVWVWAGVTLGPTASPLRLERRGYAAGPA